jgi:hypothetical protein
VKEAQNLSNGFGQQDFFFGLIFRIQHGLSFEIICKEK